MKSSSVFKERFESEHLVYVRVPTPADTTGFKQAKETVNIPLNSDQLYQTVFVTPNGIMLRLMHWGQRETAWYRMEIKKEAFVNG